MSYLPAEWHKQSLIQLTWPHKDTDWAYMLDEVNDCFLKIAYEVLKRQNLLIVAPDPDSIRNSIDNYGADIQKLSHIKNQHKRYLGTRSCFYHLVERRRYSPTTGFLF